MWPKRRGNEGLRLENIYGIFSAYSTDIYGVFRGYLVDI